MIRKGDPHQLNSRPILEGINYLLPTLTRKPCQFVNRTTSGRNKEVTTDSDPLCKLIHMIGLFMMDLL